MNHETIKNIYRFFLKLKFKCIEYKFDQTVIVFVDAYGGKYSVNF